jgi:hypothetical protein
MADAGLIRRAQMPLLTGVALIVLPYVVTGGLWTLVIGAAFAVTPYFWRS